jgi:general secretion pathway protein D
VYPGTGQFVNVAAGKPREVGATPAGDVTFNFVDTNIREVVRSILGDTLGLNYVIDPNVQGMVTVQTSRPLPRESLVAALESILGLAGAALVQDGLLYTIVPAAEAPKGAIAPTLGRRRAATAVGVGVHIVPLRFIAAEEMAKMLEPVAPSGGVLHVDKARNLLLLSGTDRELVNLFEMIDLFDVDWLKGMSFALYPVEAAEAKAIADELELMFGEKSESPMAGLLRLVPIERLNMILVISPFAAYLDDVGTWIERLDRGGETTEQRLFVYYVENGRAGELASILREIFALSEPRRDERVDLAPGLTPVEIVSTGARTGTLGTTRQAGAAGPTRPGQPAAGPGRTTSPARQIVQAQQQAAAQERARVAETERARQEPARGTARAAAPGRPGEEGLAPQVSSEIRIIADEANNALVIMATPREYRQIEAALKKLDIIPLQVLIEATIAEVRLNEELRYGVQWFFQGGNHSVTLGEGVATAAASDAVAQFFPGFSYLFNSADIRIVLNALEGVTDVNVISSPQVMVLDNSTAILQVGDQVPVPIQSAVSVTDPAAPIVNSVEFRDTGVILSVTPRVNAGGLVTMDIQQEVSDVVATTTSGIDSPTIQQRRIESTVAVQSGQTVALGGLIRDSKGVTKSGVPFLQDIPVLGALFRNTTNDTDRTELLVLITPRVVRNEGEARDVTNELRRRLRAVTPLERKIE